MQQIIAAASADHCHPRCLLILVRPLVPLLFHESVIYRPHRGQRGLIGCESLHDGFVLHPRLIRPTRRVHIHAAAVFPPVRSAQSRTASAAETTSARHYRTLHRQLGTLSSNNGGASCFRRSRWEAGDPRVLKRRKPKVAIFIAISPDACRHLLHASESCSYMSQDICAYDGQSWPRSSAGTLGHFPPAPHLWAPVGLHMQIVESPTPAARMWAESAALIS